MNFKLSKRSLSRLDGVDRDIEIIQSYIPYGSAYQEPDTIIIHSMGEYIQDEGNSEIYHHAVAFLNDYKLSAHALIAPNGSVFLCRSPNEGAWHARGHNKNTIGVEFLVSGEHNYSTFLEAIKSPYITDRQLASGVSLCKQWINEYDIKKIKRHSDISPGRKVDPGDGFNWDYFLTLLGE
jgi:N-acetyl-anhydromuramyl-L-alanine amidase AmpD